MGTEPREPGDPAGPDRDDRPSVYQRDDGIWVYRASSVGRCERQLRYARKLTPDREIMPTLQAAMDISASMEGTAIAEFERQYEVVVANRQQRVEIPVTDEAVISGSIDGLGTATRMTDGLVEVKVLSEPLYRQWLKHGFEREPGYETQFHTYVAGLRLMGHQLQGGWMVVGLKDNKDESRALLDLNVKWFDFKPAIAARAKGIVARTEAWAATDDRIDTVVEAECDLSPVCRYWYMHPKKDLPEVADAELNKWCALRAALKAEIAEDEAAVKELDEKIAGALMQLSEADDGSPVVITGSEGRFKVTEVAATTSSAWDTKALEREFPDREDLKVTRKRKGYIKVEKA